MKRKICVMLFLGLTLCACGKEEQILQKEPEEVVVEQEEEQEQQENVESAEEVQETEQVTKNEDVLAEEKTTTSLENNNTSKKNTQGTSRPKNDIDTSTDEKMDVPITESNDSKQPTTESAEPEQEEEVTIEYIHEDVKGEEVPYKYGVTKYDIVRTHYAVYSTGEKKFRWSETHTKINPTNYHATNDDLKAESEANAIKYANYYEEILKLVNEIREEAGVKPLILDYEMCKAASMRALEMDYSGVFSHTRPDDTSCFEVLSYYNLPFFGSGENIAAGASSPERVVNGWKNSPGHYANMIDASYTRLGVGYSGTGLAEYPHYWCQLFSR